MVAAAERAYVALGSNLGDRAGTPRRRPRGAGEAPGHRGRRRVGRRGDGAARRHAAAALPQPDGPARDRGSRRGQLLEACHEIERARGRVRGERWGPRTLDVDIVRYGQRRVTEPDLIIPHPELPNRDFWLRELAELQAHER